MWVLAGTNQPSRASYSKGKALKKESPMRDKMVKDHEGRRHRADTARSGGAAYAPHDKGAETLAERTGDDRTPDKTIGEIKYAKKPEKDER